MAASYEAGTSYKVPLDELRAAVVKAAERVGWGGLADTDRGFKFTIGINFWSWGENITIALDDAGTVTVKSVCSFPLQIFDWGKNRKNVQRFFACLSLLLIEQKLGLT